MRASAIIVVIILIAVLVPPYWFGMKAEEEYNNLTDNVSKYENLEIISKQYKRGWLKSDAEITYSVKNIEDGTILVKEKDTIYHGPIPIGLISKGKIMLSPVMALIETEAEVSTDSNLEYAQLINSLPKMSLETKLSFSGNGTTGVLIPEVEKNLDDGKTLKWSGLDGFIKYTSNLTNVSSVINSGELKIEDDTFQLQIGGINFESNLNYPVENYKNPLGNVNITIDEFSSEGKEGDELNKVVLSNTVISASTDRRNNLLDHTHSLGFETLTVGGNSYGPGIYELQIRNIDKAAFDEIQTVIENSEGLDQNAAQDLLYAELIKVLPELFKSSPEIEVTKLSIKTDDGEISGHAVISVDGKDLNDPDLATNPIFLLSALSADLKLSVSQPLMDDLLRDYKIEEITDRINAKGEELPNEQELRQLAQDKAQSEIKNMLDQNVLILKNGTYEIQASYGLGQIKLNGQPLDINSLLNLTSGT